mgnify:CR=1 FL=1
MKDLEAFKKDRLKLDPTAQKLSERQWKQAYAAHRKSLKRVGRRKDQGAESSGSSRGARRRSKRQQGEKTVTASGSSGRREFRARSDYRESRLIVDTLFWVALGIILLSVVIKLLYFTAASAILVAILTAALQVIGVIFFKMLFHLAADIADLSLSEKRPAAEREAHRGENA